MSSSSSPCVKSSSISLTQYKQSCFIYLREYVGVSVCVPEHTYLCILQIQMHEYECRENSYILYSKRNGPTRS